MSDNKRLNQEVTITEIVENIQKHLSAYWPIYIVSIFICVLCSWLYLRYTSPVYLVESKILIKNENGGFNTSDQKDMSIFELFNNDKVIENEVQILNSRPVIQEAVINANAQVKISQNARVKDVQVPSRFPFTIIPVHPDLTFWSSPADLIFDGAKHSFKINKATFPLENGQRIVVNKQDTFLVRCDPTKLAAWNNKPFKIEVASLDATVTQAINNLTIKTEGASTSIISLKMNATEPSLGIDLLNAIIRAYNRADLEDKRLIAQYTLNFIGERLNLVANELDVVEQSLESYKSQNEIIDISEQSKIFLGAVQQQDQEIGKIKTQLSVLDEAEKYIKGKGNNPGSAPSLIGIEDPLLLSMLSQLYTAEFELNRQIQITGEKDDATIVKKQNVEQLRQSIHEAIENSRSNLKINLTRLESELNKQNNLLKMIPSKERALVNISRQQAIKNSIYTFLLQKREEAAISFASTVSSSRLIEPCYSSKKPIKPVPIMIVLIGFLLGILLPTLFVFFKEKLNTRIHSITDIKERTNYPILGQILFESNLKGFAIDEKSRSFAAESFRTIRTKLSYYINGKEKKVIIVSSSIPVEGKTFFTLNIGRSYALIGKRTVLLTADLRRPTLHKIFNLNIKKGLSNYLVEMATAEEIIYPTQTENLFIIPVGPIPPNPSELLSGPIMNSLITKLREDFDVILIDSPPLGLISDAEILSQYADASIFLTRYNHTPKEVFENLMHDLNTSKAFKNCSIIFNGIKTTGLGDRNKYSYGYKYGYAYGLEAQKKKWWSR